MLDVTTTAWVVTVGAVVVLLAVDLACGSRTALGPPPFR